MQAQTMQSQCVQDQTVQTPRGKDTEGLTIGPNIPSISRDGRDGPETNESTASGEGIVSTTGQGTSEDLTHSADLQLQIPQAVLTPCKPEIAHTIVCREWKTEPAVLSHETPVHMASVIPEKDAVLWLIKDFRAFRNAAKVSHIPALVSPEFGGGCRLRLWLYQKKGHIVGSVDLPIVKATRDGVAHFKVSVVRGDMKAITSRKVEMRITGTSDKKTISHQRTSTGFRLTSMRCVGKPKFEHLLVGDSIRIRVEFEYFPFDAPIFRGFGRAPTRQGEETTTAGGVTHHTELLNDIRTYCRDDPTQNVEIKKDDTVFNACHFLLCARSKRFREIFGCPPHSARGSPSKYPRQSASLTRQSTLAAVTIQDISVETLDQLLTFIHTDSCPWLEDMAVDILKVIDLFEASDNYGVESLTTRCTHVLAQRVNNDNFVYLYESAERCTCEEFKKLCTDYMDSLPGSQVATLIRVNSIGASPRCG